MGVAEGHDVAVGLSPSGTRPQLRALLRGVNRRIAARAPSGLAALACECESTACEEAFEVPLRVFQVVEARPGLFLVLPGHEDASAESVVRREPGYFVVERREEARPG